MRTIELEENITTGYTWIVTEVEGDVEIQDRGHRVNEAAYASGAVGAAGTRVFEAATRTGGKVTFELRRSFEPAETPAVKTWTVELP